MQRDCSIQKYVDRAPGPDRLDYRCGHVTTDGHDGTDIRLRRATDMGRAVPVLAAADGTVLRIRDGMADVDVTRPDAPPIGNRLAGNAVVIDHGNGWETQYSHLLRGSVRVHPGKQVRAGTPIGAVGMSGNAEYPHLHFEVRHAGETIDPFAPDGLQGCAHGGPSLWTAAALKEVPYRAAEVLASGFVDNADAALAAPRAMTPIVTLADPDKLILWGAASSVLPHDVQLFRILAPNGGVILEQGSSISKEALQWIAYSRTARPKTGWVTGEYRGEYLLSRKGTLIGKYSTIVSITK